MKKILPLVVLLGCVLVVLLAIKNKKTEAPIIENRNPSEVLGYISNDKVGIFKIGDSVPSQDSLSKMGYTVTETTYTPEGMPQKLYVVSKGGKQILTFQLSPNTSAINDIRIESPEFTTNQGISVGSTISDFIKEYPQYRLWYTTEEGEKFILNTAKDNPTLQFFLGREDLVNPKANFYKTEIKTSDFKTDAKISNIRVYWLP
jgi:hypothetical protein